MIGIVKRRGEVWEAKLYLPLILLFWIPMTLLAILALWYHLRWQYFGITEGVTAFYVSRFNTSWDSYMYILGEIGWIGLGLLLLLSISYLYLTRLVIIIIYNFKRWKNL